MKLHRAGHAPSEAERACDEMMLGSWERVVIRFVPALPAGLAAPVLGGVVGAVLTMGTLQVFHERRWPRKHAYATALVLFVVVALIPIILAADGIGPRLERLL